ncbi:MAG: hypothetical protein HYX99_00335 [Chloroflexi bacterium]|nr:hypothetical protein [Chloroflexota bacterium]
MRRDVHRPVTALQRLKPWSMAAALVGVALLGYYVFLGLGYTGTSRQAAAMRHRLQELSPADSSQPPDEGALEGELQAQEDRLARLRALFSYPGNGDPMALITETARETPIALTSVALSDLQAKTQEGIRFQTQTATLTFQGTETEVRRFAAALSRKMPATSIASIRFSNQGGSSSAHIQLMFYLSPEPVPTKTPKPTPRQEG